MKSIQIGKHFVGDGEPCFFVAEIGINHNGDINLAKNLIHMAHQSGCQAVKFQKRTVEKVYTAEELTMPRESVYGTTNGHLKHGLEFGYKEYLEIDRYCKELNMTWFASCWDVDSVDFIEQFNPPCYKIASACLTDRELVEYTKSKCKPLLISTGMSTLEEIDWCIKLINDTDFMLYHCTSTYPNSIDEINLKVIPFLKERYNCPVGFSSHEKGIIASTVSVLLGACSIERHITIDRTLWGSDQAASLEQRGLSMMIRDIKNLSQILGDGEKRVYESEIPVKNKLRKQTMISLENYEQHQIISGKTK